jgi:multiple sugar transport system substrate-binding protein
MAKNFRIAVRKFDPFETAIKKIWDSFCKETGCDMELEAIPMDLHELYEATLGEGNGLKKGDWDVAYINTDWITEAYESKKIENLSPFIIDNPPEDYPQGWPNALLGMQDFEGQIYGLPFHDGPECLIYRKDLFEDEKEKKDFKDQYKRELLPPTTWEEFIEVAHFFQRPEQGLYGTAVAAYPDGHNTVFDLCLQIWARGAEIVNTQGDVDINTKGAAEGLSFYRSLLKDTKAIHPKSPEMDSIKLGMAFANGEVAMMVNWFGFASFCEVFEASKVKGCVDISDVPAGPNGKGVSLNVYWNYTIGSGSKNKNIAYNFIRYAVSKKNDKLLTIKGGTGCRKSTWNDKEVNTLVPYYYRLNDLHKNSKTLPRKTHWSEIATIIDVIVTEAINSKKSISHILQEGQEKINSIEEKYR